MKNSLKFGSTPSTLPALGRTTLSRTLRNVLIGIVGLLVLPSAGKATVMATDTIEVAYVAVDAGGQQRDYLNGQKEDTANGVMAMNTKNLIGSLAQQLPGHIWTYCYELGQNTDFSYVTYNVLPLNTAMSSDTADLIRQFWAQHYDRTWETDTYIYRGGNQGTYPSGQPANTLENQKALAFSFAVYEIYYDFKETLASLSLNSGTFTGTTEGTNPSSAISLAGDWLKDLKLPGEYTGPLANLLALKNDSLQDVIVEVPEPATLIFLVLGGLAFIRRTR